MTYERQFFQYLDNLKRTVLTQPLNLGGVQSSGGGVGGPPGGFLGRLPQSRVTYDALEEGRSGTVGSGASLLDNLNHIRKRLTNVEASGAFASSFQLQEDDVVVASGVQIINFEGAVSLLDEGGKKVTVTISGGGGGGDVEGQKDDVQVVAAATVLNFENVTSVTDEGAGKVTIVGDDTDDEAIHDNVVGEINAIAAKATPVDADILLIEDSAASWAKKKVTIVNLLATVSGSGASDFLDLDDTPASYSGQAGKSAVVNQAENALEFVTVSGSGSSPADFTYWEPMAPPTAASAYDDEFSNNSLDGKWTEFDNDTELTVTEAEQGLIFTPTGSSDIMGIWQANPSESYWSLYTRVHPLGTLTATSLKAGLIVFEDAASNPTTCDLLTFGLNYDGNGVAIMIEHWDDYNSHNANILYQYNDFPIMTGCYLRLRYSQIIIANYLSLDYSTDGISWAEVQSVDTSGYFTPDEVGLFIKGSIANKAIFSFFRATTGEQDYPTEILAGDRINGWRK